MDPSPKARHERGEASESLQHLRKCGQLQGTGIGGLRRSFESAVAGAPRGGPTGQGCLGPLRHRRRSRLGRRERGAGSLFAGSIVAVFRVIFADR